MTLNLTNRAISPGLITYAYALGGSSPYAYSVAPGGAGGSINSSSGLYTPPATVNEDPRKLYDTIVVVDAAMSSASVSVLVGDALILFCDIIQTELNLANGRVYLWDQKLNQPTDSGLYVAVTVLDCKPFGNTNKILSTGESDQSVNMGAVLQLDIISRGPAARTRKEEVIMALVSSYSQSQQEKNSFYIAPLPPGSKFVNLSLGDGAAIPYRYSISVGMQYFVKKVKASPYFDSTEVEILPSPSTAVL